MLNNMTNIAELLKDAPKGMKLYSPLLGEVELRLIQRHSGHIIVKAENYACNHEFYKDGRYFDYPYSECLLFPSNDCRTWEGWKVPKPHYDIVNFKPFDKVLVRDHSMCIWNCAWYSHYIKSTKSFYCGGIMFNQCIPYNEDTKHLLGTTDPCDEQYINW